MDYTTVTKVREHSGFVGNSNISDTRIRQYITRATNRINSALAKVYVFPLPFFWQNTLVFSGTGTGTGTMTVTVGGVSFDLAITSGLTASQAADLFRRAVLNDDNSPFKTDDIGEGATVTITAKAQSNEEADVLITSTNPQTVQGIVATAGSTLPTTHPLVEYLTTEHATALLLISEYGAESQDSDKDGFKRLGLLKSDLNELMSKNELLQDFNGVDFPQASLSRIGFSPRNGSVDEDGIPFDRRAKWNKRY